jgi:hypothetical protein
MMSGAPGKDYRGDLKYITKELNKNNDLKQVRKKMFFLM